MTQKIDDETKVVSLNDLVIARDDDGNRIPLIATLLRSGRAIMILPVTYGESLQFESREKETHDWSLKDKLMLLRNNVVKPDLSELTMEQMTNDFDGMLVDEIVEAVLLYSGILRHVAEAQTGVKKGT